MLVLIPAAGFNSQGCAGFNSGLLELKPAQPQGESPAFPGRVPASPHGRRRYPDLPTASAVGIAESETLPRASRGASLMRLLWSAAGPAPRCRGAVPVSQLETAPGPWTAENRPRGSRVPKLQASGSRASPGANRGSACKRMGAGDEQAPQATFESVDAADEFGVLGHAGLQHASTHAKHGESPKSFRLVSRGPARLGERCTCYYLPSYEAQQSMLLARTVRFSVT